jgi:hypothetical protein
MEPLTIAAATGLAMKYLVPAISELGQDVLESAENAAADEVVGFGKRILHLLLRRKGTSTSPGVSILQEGIERRVRTLADDPGQIKASMQLEGTIEELLMADPEMLAEVTKLLARASTSQVSQSGRSIHIGHDNLGSAVSGDRNMVVDRSHRG